MYKNRRRKKRNNILIIFSSCLLFVMISGYAAFNTNINITAKGNIKTKTAVQIIKTKITSSGDGLYQDTNTQNRYVYKGNNPDNYIIFNENIFRIISLEPDNTLKIVKNEALTNMPWDERTTETTGPRLNNNNTYCKLYSSGYYYGCNAWAGVNGIFTNGDKGGTVTENASLNNYLNNNYYSSLTNESKNLIISHDFNTGGIASPTSTNTLPISEVIENEKKYIWHGNIALLSVSDYLNASLEEECNSLYSARNDGENKCRNKNYLTFNILDWHNRIWLLNPWKNTLADIWIISAQSGTHSLGGAGIDSTNSQLQYASTYLNVHPALFLKSNITLTGNGTLNNPYQVKEIN